VNKIHIFFKILHDLASLVSDLKGKLILCAIKEVDGKSQPPKVFHFEIGEYKQMAEKSLSILKQGYNIYTPLAVMNPNLPIGKKGAESDIVAILGMVADFDDGKGKDWQNRVPNNFNPCLVLETSPGNTQCFFLFKKPVLIESDKSRSEIKQAVTKFINACDNVDEHGKDLCHIWRVPNSFNYPTKKKIEKGRDPNPFPVKVLNANNSSISLDLFESLPDIPSNDNKEKGIDKIRKQIGDPSTLADNKELAVEALMAIPNNLNYSDWIRISAAYKAAVGGSAEFYKKYEEWSLQWKNNTLGAVREKWDSIKDSEAGAGTIFYEARKNGWVQSGIFDKQNPYKTAEIILDDYFTINEKRILIYWQDFYLWENGVFKLTEKDYIKKKIAFILSKAKRYSGDGGAEKTKPFSPSDKDIREVLEALKLSVLIDLSEKQPPIWLNQNDKYDKNKIINIRNGLLYLPTKELLPHTPHFFSVNQLEFDYDPHASEPTHWNNFLNSIWENDPKSIEALQLYMGYLLTPDNSKQKILMVTGPTRSGKGTISEIITLLLGRRNVANPSIASLKGFGLQPLINKQLAIINDARPPRNNDTVRSIIENLLGISGNDRISIERKYKDNWSGRLSVRIILFSNEIPSSLKDPSQALVGRLVHLQMTKSFFDKEDYDLHKKLRSELPEILNWAIEGYKKLEKRGKFIQPDSGIEALNILKGNSNPLAEFIEVCCELDSNKKVYIEELCNAYKNFYNIDKVDKSDFGKNLAALHLGTIRKRDGKNYHYLGIGLKHEFSDTEKNENLDLDSLLS
jgi:putative DNA primase/helicase